MARHYENFVILIQLFTSVDNKRNSEIREIHIKDSKISNIEDEDK